MDSIVLPILNYNKENESLEELLGEFNLQHEEDLVGIAIKNLVEADSETQHTSDELKGKGLIFARENFP